MKYSVKIGLILCSFLLLFSCNDDNERRTDLNQEFYELTAKVCSETETPGASVYVRSPRYGNFALAWGKADIELNEPVKTNQPFRIGSLTKSFTAAAVLKLAERRRLDLNAPISSYLGLIDGYEPLARISVRQLLNMSSGLEEYLSTSFLTDTVLPNPDQEYQPVELLSRVFDSDPELLFPPGSEFRYTNTNYILLGLLIEEISGRSYRNFIQENFLIPLALQDTDVIAGSRIPPFLARGYYDFDEDGSYEDWTEMNMSYVWSAGCIVSTAENVAIWMDTLARGELFDEDILPYLFEGTKIAEGVEYGAGILVDENFGIGHNGTVIGYHSDAWHDPSTGATVAVLCNTNAPLQGDKRDPTREIAAGILEILDK